MLWRASSRLHNNLVAPLIYTAGTVWLSFRDKRIFVLAPSRIMYFTKPSAKMLTPTVFYTA